MIDIEDRIESLDFDTRDGCYPGANIHDWFDGSELLVDAGNIMDRINASFGSRALAMDWLRKSYLGADTEGVGVLVDGEALA